MVRMQALHQLKSIQKGHKKVKHIPFRQQVTPQEYLTDHRNRFSTWAFVKMSYSNLQIIPWHGLYVENCPVPIYILEYPRTIHGGQSIPGSSEDSTPAPKGPTGAYHGR